MVADILSTFFSLFFLFFVISLFTRRQTNKILNERLKCYNKLLENIFEEKKENISFDIKSQTYFLSLIEDLNKKINILKNQIEKSLYTLVLLKNFQSYSVAKTITKILEAPKVPDSLEINIAFLENLKEEYTYLKKGLSEELQKSEKDIDIIQKDRMNKIIEELDSIIIVLSTISKESSAQYIEEIFKEVTASFMKIHGINNI